MLAYVPVVAAVAVFMMHAPNTCPTNKPWFGTLTPPRHSLLLSASWRRPVGVSIGAPRLILNIVVTMTKCIIPRGVFGQL
jgi:hypothetical protein